MIGDAERNISTAALDVISRKHCPDGMPTPLGRGDADYSAAFARVNTNDEWMLEERLWADALAVECEWGFVLRDGVGEE